MICAPHRDWLADRYRIRTGDTHRRIIIHARGSIATFPVENPSRARSPETRTHGHIAGGIPPEWCQDSARPPLVTSGSLVGNAPGVTALSGPGAPATATLHHPSPTPSFTSISIFLLISQCSVQIPLPSHRRAWTHNSQGATILNRVKKFWHVLMIQSAGEKISPSGRGSDPASPSAATLSSGRNNRPGSGSLSEEHSWISTTTASKILTARPPPA